MRALGLAFRTLHSAFDSPPSSRPEPPSRPTAALI